MLDAPNVAPVPLGVYDNPPPEEFSFVKGINVGGGLASDAARFGTKLINDLNRKIPDWKDLL